MDIARFDKQSQYTADMRKTAAHYTSVNKSCESGGIVLAGDSLIAMLDCDKLFCGFSQKYSVKVYNRGICGDTSNRLEERFEDNVLSLKPHTLILLIGTNDMARGANTDYTLNNIRCLVQRAKRSGVCRIIVQCVYPVNNSIYKNPAHMRNPADIAQLNNGIKKLSGELAVETLDLTALLSDQTGSLKAEFTSDGLHPNDAGFKLIAKEIEKVLSSDLPKL